MALGDKVLLRFIDNEFDTSINCRQQGCLPLIGTVDTVPGAGTSRVVWPTGEFPTVPDEVLLKIFDLDEFGDAAALSWGFDVGKYVQITEYPFAGIRAVIQDAFPGAVVPPQSPAGSGIVSLVLALGEISGEGPDFICAWIAVQDGKKHIAVLGAEETNGVPPFAKPYVEEPGRRAVGIG